MELCGKEQRVGIGHNTELFLKCDLPNDHKGSQNMGKPGKPTHHSCIVTPKVKVYWSD